MKHKTTILVLLIGIGVALLWGVSQCTKRQTGNENLRAYADTTALYHDSQGRLTAERQSFQLTREKDLNDLNSKDKLIALLQDERKSVPGKIRSAVAVALRTHSRDTFITVVSGDTIIVNGDTTFNPVYSGTVSDAWRTLSVEAHADSIHTDLTVRDSLGIFISWARGGLFKSKVPVATVKSSSPYTDSIDVRSVIVDKKQSVFVKILKLGAPFVAGWLAGKAMN